MVVVWRVKKVKAQPTADSLTSVDHSHIDFRGVTLDAISHSIESDSTVFVADENTILHLMLHD